MQAFPIGYGDDRSGPYAEIGIFPAGIDPAETVPMVMPDGQPVLRIIDDQGHTAPETRPKYQPVARFHVRSDPRDFIGTEGMSPKDAGATAIGHMIIRGVAQALDEYNRMHQQAALAEAMPAFMQPFQIPPVGSVNFVAWNEKRHRYDAVELPEDTPDKPTRSGVYVVFQHVGKDEQGRLIHARLTTAQKPTAKNLGEAPRFLRVGTDI